MKEKKMVAREELLQEKIAESEETTETTDKS